MHDNAGLADATALAQANKVYMSGLCMAGVCLRDTVGSNRAMFMCVRSGVCASLRAIVVCVFSSVPGAGQCHLRLLCVALKQFDAAPMCA